MAAKTFWPIFFTLAIVRAEIQQNYATKPAIRVNKCCEQYELSVEGHCVHMNETNETIWAPTFFNENGKTHVQVEYIIITGRPDCGSTQEHLIYYYPTSTDVLRLLPNGVMRHYLYHALPDEDIEENSIDVSNGQEMMYHDYEPGKYCMDKIVVNHQIEEYAIVCTPQYASVWTSTDYIMRNIVSPVTHGINMTCLLIVAIIYFIMPTLRDLVGNIVTTITMCLIVSQAADMTRLLTVFTNHFNLIIAEAFCYIALLGAFFWLNSLGYYIWKTFRSRNVFLRITDGKKYCYYSAYAWACTIILGALAIFAHFTMDYPPKKKITFENKQDEIGSLGIFIFFVPIAFTVIANIFFFATTLRILNRMNTYGRIHHKLKHSFRMFLLLFLIMTITWLLFLLSFSKFESLINCYILVNALQAPLILYVCVFNQKHVSFLVRKTCCYTDCVCPCCRPEPECEWGDEMAAMSTDIY